MDTKLCIPPPHLALNNLKVNKTTYVLLIIVLGIWGYFIISLISDLSGDYDLPLANEGSLTIKKIKSKERETFNLIDNPRDPFFGKTRSKNTSTVTSRVKPTPSKPWPNIIYKGQIKGNGSSTRYILSINGSEHLLKQGDALESVTLISANETDAKLRFEGQTKTFSRQ